MNLTFADLLTPTGVIGAAALITTLVELLKRTFPPIDARVSGAFLAFVFSAVLYIFAGIATRTATPDDALLVFTSWLACAVASVGIKATTVHVAGPDREVPQP